ncbi:hypothetical protein [Pseudomonas sp. MWU12-2345]|uniref:hypothetical protein n=1 Tax=Pseudomonas sp. MWU12-2345 TaxID=2928689 RepID=UPI00200D1703|nr:hypothetical protein [Pseudomonas sp. MWU12-2345]
MSAEQKIITIDDISAENAPAIYVAGGLGRFLDAVKAEVTAEVPDLASRKGRERIASLAAKVSKSKAAVEKPGREYLKRLKEMPKVVEAELREFVDHMDALRDATRQPLTDWETAEQTRKDGHIDAIQAMKDLVESAGPLDSARIQTAIDELEAKVIGDAWEEFLPEAAQVKDQGLTALRGHLKARQVYEAEQAELVRLREEAEQRAKKDREDQIAREAAQRATQEAEQKAQHERDAAAQRVRDEQAAAQKREDDLKLQAAESERRAEQAKREQLEAAQRAAQQKLDDEERHCRAVEQAEADRLAAEQRAEQERIDSEARAQRAAEQARMDEQRRQKEAADEILRQAAAREADKAHQAKINRAALEAFIAGGMPEACAKQAVTLIAQRKIPAIYISY